MTDSEQTDRELGLVVEAIEEILEDRRESDRSEQQLPPVVATTKLFDDGSGEPSLELDSLDALDLIAMLEERVGVLLPEDIDFEGIRTVGDVAVVLRSAMT